MNALSIEGLDVTLGDLPVVRGLDLYARPGEFVSILGPSGSGKSTTFGVLTGAVTPDRGDIRITGDALRTGDSRVAFMPQKDALLPWRTVLGNVTLGLEVRGTKRSVAREKVRPLLEPFGLDGFENRYPAQLSGGMRQRAALLRTVAQEQPVLLLDEPFGALDALTRSQMQRWLQGMWEKYRWTVLLITHDVREALYLSDRVYVFSPRPARVAAEVAVEFERPRRPELIGDPAFAALEAELLKQLIG
ncbi:ABC transporter ATP-binding protein [Kineosporia succinea]|uniref:ABC-type nitrate/sulfonate/bicarbonate transport system ATPase subunit n=1 Tax=Kineosporia succinea TaxID=84632 RepID=A0ABT9P8S0_9ACTN|nr:ABC transporter ATP-binding protein [Kineosporia succinea]MDP9829089.1 ABC-type nitrate/sulfonate/bicarbonate transport system ATPase subunit [Kineosporia succinea]